MHNKFNLYDVAAISFFLFFLLLLLPLLFTLYLSFSLSLPLSLALSIFHFVLDHQREIEREWERENEDSIPSHSTFPYSNRTLFRYFNTRRYTQQSSIPPSHPSTALLTLAIRRPLSNLSHYTRDHMSFGRDRQRTYYHYNTTQLLHAYTKRISQPTMIPYSKRQPIPSWLLLIWYISLAPSLSLSGKEENCLG